MMKHIAIIEDERLMREELEALLTAAGYQVSAAGEGDPQRIFAEKPDLILLDLNLPGRSGFQLCQEIREKSTIPILVLTSRDQMSDELHALSLGADEYLTKPCRAERLLARISNILKRCEGQSCLRVGKGFRLDPRTYTLYVAHDAVILPKNQGKLLEALMDNKTVTKEALCLAVWGTAEFIDENALQVNLTRLKKTLSGLGLPQKIVPVRGVGYRMEENNHEA